jgi:protein phosphatase
VELANPFSSLVTLEIGASSIRGTLRAQNTNHYLAIKIDRGVETVYTSLGEIDYPQHFKEHGYAMFVADGIGSHGVGARASREALSALAHLAITHGHWSLRVGPDVAKDIKAQIEFYFRRVDDELRRAGLDFPDTGLATSLTMVAVAGKDLFFTSVGQSKAFLFRSGRLIQLIAHTATPPESGKPPADESPQNAKRSVKHVVAEALGGRTSDIDVETEQIQLESDDRLLLCTNGLTDCLSEDEIADALSLRRSPQDDCQELVDLAVLRGSYDNITVMLADYVLHSD